MRQRKGRADGKHQTDHRSERRHDERIEHIAQHGRLMHGVLEVLRIGKAARQQPRREKFRRSFEGTQNTVDHREDQHQTQSDGQHGQHIDEHHPDALGDLVAEQGGEGGGHGQVLFAVEVHIGDEHAGQGVHGIGDHGPVIEAAAHGKPGGLVRQGLDAIAVQLAVDVAEVDQHLVHAVGDQAGGSDPHILHRGEEESAIHEIVGPGEIVQRTADIGVPLHIQRPGTHGEVHHGRGQREVPGPALHILQQILHDLVVLLHHAERDLAQLLLGAVCVDGENAHAHQEQRDQGTGDALFQCLSENGVLSADPQAMYLFPHGPHRPLLRRFSSAVRPCQPDCAFLTKY